MKTIHSISRYVLALILMMAAAQQLQAQDAFYIYRNDGDFNGFFFDEIVRMSYSKTDLEGEEHNEYVIQEVETKDSLYRIPLCAIDSIGFQQPEIRFSKKLKNIDESGLMDYFQWIRLRSKQICFDRDNDIPAHLIPNVGDVLVSYDERMDVEDDAIAVGMEDVADQMGSFCSNGFFVGKVTDVSHVYDGTLVIEYDYVTEIGDIFEQFITTEQVGYTPEGNVRRRIAGFNPDGTLRNSPRKASGSAELTLFSFSGRLQKEWKPMDHMSITAGIDIGMEAKLQATYSITGVFDQHLFVKLEFKENFSAGASIAATVSTDAEIPLTPPLGVFPAIKFPAVFPIFEVNPIPVGFVRVHGQIEGKISTPQLNIGLAQTVTIDTDNPWLMSFDWRQQDNDGNYKVVDGDFTDSPAALTFSGFIQGGIKSTLGLSTNSWLAKLLHAGIGLEIYSGPKLSGSISTELSGSYLEFYPWCVDRELKYKWRVGKKKEERTLWSDTKPNKGIRFLLAPEFKKSDVVHNKTAKTVTVTLHPTGKVFTRSYIGVGIVRSDPDVIKDYKELYSYGEWYTPTGSKDYTGIISVDTLWYGEYRVFPSVMIDGHRIEGSYLDDFIPTIEIPYEETHDIPVPEKIVIGPKGGSFTYKAKTNFPEYHLQGVYGYQTYEDDTSSVGGIDSSNWVTVSVNRLSAEAGQAEYVITFTVKPNTTLTSRYHIFNVGYAENQIEIYQDNKEAEE